MRILATSLFSCGHATLNEALSEGLSIRWSVVHALSGRLAHFLKIDTVYLDLFTFSVPFIALFIGYVLIYLSFHRSSHIIIDNRPTSLMDLY